MKKKCKSEKFCAYCSTWENTGFTANAGNMTLKVKDKKTLQELKRVQQEALDVYTLNVCPACATIIGVNLSVDRVLHGP
jgi:hypothetical protein